MNTTTKSIFISISSLFSVLFLVFAIGMCIPNFRQTMFRVWDVVPSQQYTEKLNSETELTNQLNLYSSELQQLESEKQSLIDEVSRLQQNADLDEITITNKAQEIDKLKIEIEDLDNEIETLNEKILQISANISGATLTYKGAYVQFFVPILNDEGSVDLHICLSGTEGHNWLTTKTDILNRIDDFNANDKDKIEEGLASTKYTSCIETYDAYKLYIQDVTNEFTVFSNNTEILSNDTTFKVIYKFDDIEKSYDDFCNLMNDNSNYRYQLDTEYDKDNSAILYIYNIHSS